MAVLTAEAIVFAINSAIKLGRNIQRAYAKNLKSKELILPLPAFDGVPTPMKAEEFFSIDDDNKGGMQFVRRIERLGKLHDEQVTIGLNEDGAVEYVSYYELFWVLQKEDQIRADDTRIHTEDMVALLRIRQWETGKEPPTSPLQLVAGTLVEIGIDYFNQVPGALNTGSSYGRIMRSFLSAIDEVTFSDAEEFKTSAERIVPKLFISAAEAIGELSSEISADPKVQAFIKATSKGIAQDIFKRAKEGGDEDEAIQWGQMLLRSMVKNAGHYVFHSADDLLGANEGQALLIQSTGMAFLEVILDAPNDQFNIKGAFTTDTLDKVVRAALGAVAECPELIERKHEGIKAIISGVARALAAHPVLKNRPDLLPELVRLILEHTAQNFDLLWGSTPAGGDHLLFMGLQQILTEISRPPVQGKWRPQLTKTQLLDITANLLDDVVKNPAWVKDKVQDKPMLQEVLCAVFDALENIPKEQRLNIRVINLLIRLSIRTAVTSRAVLERIQWADDVQEKTILNKALDMVFHYVDDLDNSKGADRVPLLMDLLEYILEVIISKHPNSKGLILADLVLFKTPGIDYAGGFNRELADQIVNAALKVLNERPDLVTNHVALQAILAGVAGALEASSFHQAGILPELLRLALEHTARNAALVVPAEHGEPRYLLTMALKEILEAVSDKPDPGRWQPRLTGTQVVQLVHNLFDEVVQYPDWVIAGAGGQSLLAAALDAVFDAFRHLPKDQRLTPDALRTVLKLSLRAVTRSKALLDRIHWGRDEEEIVLLNKALDLVFAYVFPEGGEASIDKTAQLLELTEYALDMVVAQYPDKRGLLLLNLIFFKDPEFDIAGGFRREQAERLTKAALRVFAEHPELVSRDAVFQKILGDTASALKASKLPMPELLPELFRLALENTAGQVDRIMKLKVDGPKNLIATAIEQTLRAIAAKPKRGKWKPALSPEQTLDIVSTVIGETLQNPQWVRNDKLILIVMEAVFRALECIPDGRDIPYETVKFLMEKALEAVAARQQMIVIEIPTAAGDEKKLALTYSLECVFIELYDENNQSSGTWTLTQTPVIQAIMEFFLLGISEGPVDKPTIDASVEKIKKAVSDINNNLHFTLEGLLEGLERKAG